MHVHCLHWLMLTGLLFQSALCRLCKSMNYADYINPWLVIWHQRRPPIWLWGHDMAPIGSACLSIGIVVEYWPFVGTCTHHSSTKLYYLCLLASLLTLLLPPTPPLCSSHLYHPCAPPTHPLIYAGPILMHSIQEMWKLVRISHYLGTCQVSCTKANR